MDIRPKPGDEYIRVPITFDYSGGRGDQRRGNILTTLIIIVVSIILTIGAIKNTNFEVWQRILAIIVVWGIGSTYIRFKLFREGTYSDVFEGLKETDFTPDTKSFWKVYEVDTTFPYIHHFADGRHAVFVRMNKDAVVGKPDDIIDRHYNAISEMLNRAWGLNMNVVIMDYMDNVGNDPRLNGLYDSLNNCSYNSMKSLMLSMYSYWQDCMMEDYASFDVYGFISRANPDDLWLDVQNCINELMKGNYISSNVLNLDGSRVSCMALFNLTDFSAREACEKVVETRQITGVIPISLLTNDGEIKINKTQAEKRAEEEARQQAEYEEYLQKKENSPVKRARRTAAAVKERYEWSKAQVEAEKKKAEEAITNKEDLKDTVDLDTKLEEGSNFDTSSNSSEAVDLFDMNEEEDIANAEVTVDEATDTEEVEGNATISNEVNGSTDEDEIDLFD